MNNSHNDTLITNESILLMDRSLREMLASGDERSRDNGDNESYVMSNRQRVIELESQLLAAKIALEGEQNEVSCLKCHIELLGSDYDTQKSELDTMKTTLNKQKSDIKRLSRDNDSLRREISRVTGIRQFTDDVSRNNAMVRTESEAQKKLAEFRETVTIIASSLIEALDFNSAQEPDSDRVSNSVPQDNCQSNSMAKRLRRRCCHVRHVLHVPQLTSILLVHIRRLPVSAHPRQPLSQIPLPQPHPSSVSPSPS